MDVERPAIRHLQALRCDGLNSDIISARRDGALDPGAQQVVEHAEQCVLHIDGERQQPVEQGSYRLNRSVRPTLLRRYLNPGRAGRST